MQQQIYRMIYATIDDNLITFVKNLVMNFFFGASFDAVKACSFLR